MRLARLALLVLASALTACQGANPQNIAGAITTVANPQTLSDVRGATADIDEPEEVELGRSITAAVGARYRVVRDPALTKYVALVGNAVAATSDRPDMRYQFAVLDTPEINAFAAPGGFVFVSRGALDLMQDEAALAGVLGHEVGHVALRHHGKTIKAQKRKALGVKAVQVGASFTQAAPFVGLIGTMADALGEEILNVGHSQPEEMEADKVGFQYAARAGYDPAGLREFLATLKGKGPTDAGALKFSSTHPGIPERLEEQTKLRQAWDKGGKREAARFAQALKRASAKPVEPPKPAPKPADQTKPAPKPGEQTKPTPKPTPKPTNQQKPAPKPAPKPADATKPAPKPGQPAPGPTQPSQESQPPTR
jgi:predicted Zn-dependent protease